MIDPGEGYRLLREGELMLVTDEYCDRSGEWEPTDDDVEREGWKWSADEWLPHRRKRVPLDDSIERLIIAMQRPDWAAALLGELPKQLRDDIAMVLTHFIMEKP